MVLDRFGITELNPSKGFEWFSNWDNGVKRTVNSEGVSVRNRDPSDAMVDFHCLSYSTEGNQFIVYGNGQAKLRGKHPRLYINHVNQDPLWGNIEMTIYGRFTKCIVEKGSYTTYRLAGRSNHQNTHKCKRDAKGYAAEIFIRQDTLMAKDARFRKELVHPHYANSSFPVPIAAMSNWVGMKFICKTINEDQVLNQCFLDYSNGQNGGVWNKAGEFVDTGKWAITSSKELANIDEDINSGSGCIDTKPVKPYNEKVLRKGASCYLRTDYVQDCYFKNFSIRSI